MRLAIFTLLAFAMTGHTQDESSADPLARDKTLLASADGSAPDGPMPAQSGLTGSELFEGLEAAKRLPQLDKELEELSKEMEAVTFFSLSNFLDILRAYFLGGEPTWRKESDLRMAKLDTLIATSNLAVASSEFVEAIHDAESGVSFSCPKNHTMGEMFEIVRVWLQENPRQQHLPAETCVINALKTKWPKRADGPAARDAERVPRKPEAE